MIFDEDDNMQIDKQEFLKVYFLNFNFFELKFFYFKNLDIFFDNFLCLQQFPELFNSHKML